MGDRELEGIIARKLELFRIEPPRPIRSGALAGRFVKERRMVMLTGRSALPILTEAIAGREIRGSWMADPEVHRIYRVMNRIDAGTHGISQVRLILGKEVLIDDELSPAVQRVASDRGRIARAREALTSTARRLLQELEGEGQVRMDEWKVPTKEARPARMLLETQLLAVGEELHTENGYHTSVLRLWKASTIAKRFGTSAKKMTYEAAQDMLLEAALKAAVVASEREARRWFPFGGDRIESLVSAGEIRRLAVGRQRWLIP